MCNPHKKVSNGQVNNKKKSPLYFNAMNPENKYSKGIGNDNESRLDKKNVQGAIVVASDVAR